MSEKEDQDVADKTSDSTTLQSVTEREKELAQNSFQKFEKGKYESCLQILDQLSASRPTDPKVLLNKSVARFYLSRFTSVDEFKDSLSQVSNQTQLASRENNDLDDVDHCVVFYNQAVLLYHTRKYRAAITILDKVFQFIEPIEEGLARRVCFLLLDLYLCTFQTEKAMNLVGYIETTFGSQCSTESKSQSPDKDKEKNGKETDSATDENSTESYKIKLQLYKTRLYIMLKSMKACKREIKSLMNSMGVNLSTVYLKSNLEYLRGNYRKALKLLNSVPHPTQAALDSGENSTIMYYNNVGCIHFYMGKPHLGAFYFRQALLENERLTDYLNKSNNNDGKGKTCMLAYGATRHCELLFNLGVQLLYSRRPEEAFDCLLEAIQVYPTNVRLWLRLAECCIMVNKPSNATDFQLAERQKDIVQGLVGTGVHRKVILTPEISKQNSNSETQSPAMPMPTLEFASLCLKNALLLHQDDTQGLSNLSTSLSSEEALENSNVSHEIGQYLSGFPGNPIRGIEVTNLRSSILAASCYISLCLRDTVMALQYAQTLLAQPKISGIHKLLGHLYMGESLVLLDRISEAIEHLNPDLIKDIPLSFHLSEKEEKENKPENQQELINLQHWYPNTSSAARTILQYNATVAFALRGEYEKASESLKKVMGLGAIGNARHQNNDVPVQAVLLALYIHLQQGHIEMTKNLIKQHIPQLR